MFCNRCGTEISPDSLACPKCHRQTGDLVRAIAQSRLERHLHTLAMLWIVFGGLFLIPSIFLMLTGSSAHFVIHRREPFGPAFGPFLFYLIGGGLLVLGAAGICVGLGLLQRRPLARTAALVLGVLTLFHPPFGTALGIYTLWIFLADENGDEYRFLARANQS